MQIEKEILRKGPLTQKTRPFPVGADIIRPAGPVYMVYCSLSAKREFRFSRPGPKIMPTPVGRDALGAPLAALPLTDGAYSLRVKPLESTYAIGLSLGCRPSGYRSNARRLPQGDPLWLPGACRNGTTPWANTARPYGKTWTTPSPPQRISQSPQ